MSSLISSVKARRLGQVAVDACLIGLAYYLAYVLRFDSGVPHRYEELLTDTFVFVVVMKLAVFALFGLYSKLWRFVDQKDFESLVKAVVVSSFVLIAALFLLSAGRHQPSARGDGARLPAHARLLRQRPLPGPRRGGAPPRPAGGVRRPRGADRRRRQRRPVGGHRAAPQPRPVHGAIGFIDDDPRKRGMRIAGFEVLGSTDDLPRVLDDTQPSEVVIAIPSAPGVLRQKVVTACRSRDIPVRTLPTTFELLSGGVNLVRQVRELKVEDVLGREPVRVELDRMGPTCAARPCW